MTQNLTSRTYIPWPFSSPLARPRSMRLCLSLFFPPLRFFSFFFFFFFLLPFLTFILFYFLFILNLFPSPVSPCLLPLLSLSSVSFSLSSPPPSSRCPPPPPHLSLPLLYHFSFICISPTQCLANILLQQSVTRVHVPWQHMVS